VPILVGKLLGEHDEIKVSLEILITLAHGPALDPWAIYKYFFSELFIPAICRKRAYLT
jgi:hypothetical protein